MNDNRISVIPINNATKNPYMNIAAAIIKSAIDDHDEAFFKQKWGESLCEWLNVDADLALTISREKHRKQKEYYRKYYKEKVLVKNVIPVRCVETGKVYESASAASRVVGKNVNSILKCCHGERVTCAGFHWEYYNV